MVTAVEVGSVWREVETGRRIRVLEEEIHGTGPAWTYIDADGEPEAHGEQHPEWFWHYCDVCDFVLWGRFVLDS
jgi:hypothetical protein